MIHKEKHVSLIFELDSVNRIPAMPLQDHFDSSLSRADEAGASLEALLVPDF